MERRDWEKAEKTRGIRSFPSCPTCAFRSSPVPSFNFRALRSALGKPGEEVETVTPLRKSNVGFNRLCPHNVLHNFKVFFEKKHC